MKDTILRRNWDASFGFIIILIDLILYNLALYTAYNLRWASRAEFDEKYFELYIVINIIFLIVGAFSGLFRSLSKGTLESQKAGMRRFTYYLALFLMSYLYIIKGHEFSRGVVIIFLMVQYVFLDAFHVLLVKFKNVLAKKGIGVWNTLIVGADKSASDFYINLKNNFKNLYNVIGFTKNGFPEYPPEEIQGQIIGQNEDIDRILNKYPVDRVFIVSDSMLQKKYEPIRLSCENNNVKLKMVSPQTLSLINSAHVSDITGVPLTTDYHRRKISFIRKSLKRLSDLLLSFSLISMLSPILLLVALLIKLTSPGSIIFKQKRSLYKGGKEFYFYKFRTMYINADDHKKKLNHLNETNGALFKIKNDPRVTIVGKFLRRYSLDELPQLFNVLKGDMSMVGPRPLPIADFSSIQNGKVNYDWYTKRGETKPGITGLWQISGRSKLTFEEMVMLDLYYIENQSLFFDIEILFETIPTVLTAKGAY